MSRGPIRAGTSGLDGSAATLPTMTASPFSPLILGADRGESKVEHVEIRRSEPSDAEQIQKLLNPQSHSYFGPRCDVLRILEHANLSLSLSYPHGGLCAHASFFDFPVSMRALDQAYWEEWISGAYPELGAKATPFNSLFLGLFLYQDVIKTEALEECLRTAFDLVPTLQYIFLVLPKDKHLVSVYQRYFTKCEEVEKVDLEVEKVDLEAEKVDFEVEKVDLAAEKVDLEAEKVDFEAEKVYLEAEKVDFEVEKVDLAAEKVDLEAEKVDFEAEKVDLEAEKGDLEAEKGDLEVEKGDLEVEKGDLEVEQVETIVQSDEKPQESSSSSESTDEGIESTEDLEKEPDLTSEPSEQVVETVEEAEQPTTTNIHVDLYLAERHTLLPTLHVREAREEDSDDLSPLFLRHTEELHMSYGDYFIAELVTGGPNNTSLVAEVDGRAVGFISITTDVDIEVLGNSFRLEPFHGLKCPCDEDEVKEVEIESITGSESSILDGKGKLQDSKQSSVKSLASQLGQGSNRELSKFVDRGSTASLLSRSDTGASIEGSAIVDQAIKPSVSFPAEGASTVLSTISQSTQRTLDNVERSRKSSAVPVQTVTEELEIKREKTKELVSIFKGKPNALSVQLFCLDDKYESRALDFLPSIFKQWPVLEYCVLTQPYTLSEHPVLQQGFSRVSPKPGVSFPHELYLMHKATLLDLITVSYACESDYKGVKSLVTGLKVAETVLEDLSHFLAQNRDPVSHGAMPLYFFIAKCLTQLIGIVVVRTEQEIEYIRARYNIEEFIYFNYHRQHEHGHLHFCILNPIFQRHTKFILKEVLRQSHKTSLYFPLYPVNSAKSDTSHLAVSAINAMIPVRPRRQIQYALDRLLENAPSAKITTKQEPCVLYHFNRKLTLEPKIAVNNRIVLVGASDVALTFLQFLLYNSSHLIFNNLTLLSKNGLPSHEDDTLVNSECLQPYELIGTSLSSVANIINGEVTQIDRDKKTIRTQGNDVIFYDNLLLCCGEQFQLPKSSGVSNPVYTCNDACDLRLLKNNLDTLVNKETNIVIYGNTVESYTMVNFVVNQGILSERVYFVLPPHIHGLNPFNNKHILDKMIEIFTQMKITVIHGCIKEFICLETDENDWNVVLEIGDGDEKEEFSLAYSLLVYLHEKDVDSRAFKAMNDACLVYDGRLVIDRDFHTNDSCIFAAGPLTKFSRKYYCDPWRLKYYNSREVGERLAIEVLKKFDPLQAEPTEIQDQNLIQNFSRPKIIHAILPGDKHYLDVFKPIPDELKNEQKSKFTSKRELVTKSDDSGYFRIILDENGYIIHVTCLANAAFEVENIIALFGMHEKLLNNLHTRYKSKKIPDFYSFFRESSVVAVFHDRFEDFKMELQQILATQPLNAETDETFQDKVHQLLKKDWKMTDLQLNELKQIYNSSETRGSIRRHLMNYLNYNSYHIPMYAKGNHGMNADIII